MSLGEDGPKGKIMLKFELSDRMISARGLVWNKCLAAKGGCRIGKIGAFHGMKPDGQRDDREEESVGYLFACRRRPEFVFAFSEQAFRCYACLSTKATSGGHKLLAILLHDSRTRNVANRPA